MRKIKTLCIVAIATVTIGLIASCEKKEEPKPDSSILETKDSPITDFEGNSYNTVKIGDQVWMTENLKAKFTSDGTEVLEAYVYNNSESNLAEYGRLYTWEAAKNPFIEGWHLPSEAEWNILENYLGDDVATKLKVGGNSGFGAKFGGYRAYTGEFVGIDSQGSFWTSSVYTSDHSFVRNLFSFNNNFEHGGCGNIGGNAVRLIKN